MIIFDVALHVLLVYTVVIALYVGYINDELIRQVSNLITSNFSPITISLPGLDVSVLQKLGTALTPSSCLSKNNNFLLTIAFCIWLVLALIVIISLILSNMTRAEFINILWCNAIVLIVACVIEIGFFLIIIQNYSPISKNDVYTIIQNAFKNLLK